MLSVNKSVSFLPWPVSVMSSVSNVKSVHVDTCKHVWVVSYKDFCEDIVESSYFCLPSLKSVKWRSRLTPIHPVKRNKDNHGTYHDTELWLTVTNTSTDITTNGTYGGEVEFSLGSEKQKITFKGAFVLNDDAPYFIPTSRYSCHGEKIVIKFSLCKKRFAADVTVKCQVTLFKLVEAIPVFISHIQGNTIPLEVAISNPFEDFGKLYLNEELSDVTICIKSKDEKSNEYPAHKIILSARSKVFNAMFQDKMKKSTLDHVYCAFDRVIVEGIKEEVFLEMLRYIYTGNVQNLDTLAFELLPVADRYDLQKLKIACGNVFLKNLSVQNAVEIVTVADMYNVGDLKKKTTRFIKEHSADVSKKTDSKAWEDLMSRPRLMKDLLIASMN